MRDYLFSRATNFLDLVARARPPNFGLVQTLYLYSVVLCDVF